MDALRKHLAQRDPRATAARVRWLDGASRLPGTFRNWVIRRAWGASLRHMRWVTPGVLFDARPDGAWGVSYRGKPLATGVPLDCLLGRIDRPVSLVATGPTARDYPWEAIRSRERFVIAVNGAPTFLKDQAVIPDLLVVTDPRFAESGLVHFRNAPGVPLVTTCRAAAVLAAAAPEELQGRGFSIIERVNAWYAVPTLPLAELYALNEAAGSPFHFPEDESLRLKVGWSDAPQLGFFSGCTVVSAALQVAVGLGATEIEIIGMDLDGQGRIYAEGSDVQPSLLQDQYSKYILPSFEIMHRALLGSGVRIHNLSPVCPLPRGLFSG